TVEMELELRCWDVVVPVALGIIFKKPSLQDILIVGIVAVGPNFEDWSRLQLQDKINQVIEMLIS
ncbi:hypothetical protein MKW92_039827, partial [Papaver armeniacum]